MMMSSNIKNGLWNKVLEGLQGEGMQSSESPWVKNLVLLQERSEKKVGTNTEKLPENVKETS